MKLSHTWFLLLVLAFGSMLPMRAAAQTDLEQRVSTLEHRVASQDQEGAGVAVFVCAAFLALWAQNTGRNAWLWFFLGLFFSVIVIFVMLYKNSNDRKIGKR
jgi:cell division protein FtsW (lipid II flippase)